MFYIEGEKQMKIALEKGGRTLEKIGVGLSKKTSNLKIALEKGWRTLGKIGIGLSKKRQI